MSNKKFYLVKDGSTVCRFVYSEYPSIVFLPSEMIGGFYAVP